MMSWNREAQIVTGMYLGEHRCRGVVTLSRVKYGGRVQHTVVLLDPLYLIFSSREHERTTILLDEEELVYD
jgi:hypothetical protein